MRRPRSWIRWDESRDGAALLGHSSSEITRRTYVNAVPAGATQAVEKVEKLIGPKWTQVSENPKLASVLIQ